MSSSRPADSPTAPWWNSYVALTDTPGIGFESKSAFYDVLRKLPRLTPFRDLGDRFAAQPWSAATDAC